ncbi:MAG: FtsX-like permease family protein [Bryobacteraceae bacterium]
MPPLEDQSDCFELRLALPEDALREAIVNAVATVNREIPIEIHTLTAQVDESMTRERMLAPLSGFFGGLALLPATIGLYGTLSYLVAQRRIEFGTRMAMGATSRSSSW